MASRRHRRLREDLQQQPAQPALPLELWAGHSMPSSCCVQANGTYRHTSSEGYLRESVEGAEPVGRSCCCCCSCATRALRGSSLPLAPGSIGTPAVGRVHGVEAGQEGLVLRCGVPLVAQRGRHRRHGRVPWRLGLQQHAGLRLSCACTLLVCCATSGLGIAHCRLLLLLLLL